MHIFCILQPPEDREISALAARKPAAFEEILRLDREKIGQYSARTAEKIEKTTNFYRIRQKLQKCKGLLNMGRTKRPGSFSFLQKN